MPSRKRSAWSPGSGHAAARETEFNPPPAHRPQRYTETQAAAACLVRVLARQGVEVPVADVVARLRASPLSGDVVNFLDVAEGFGLEGLPRVLTSGEWPRIPPGSILHWGRDRLVVCEETFPDGFALYDPERGERRVDRAEFGRSFTGVALVFLRAGETEG